MPAFAIFMISILSSLIGAGIAWVFFRLKNQHLVSQAQSESGRDLVAMEERLKAAEISQRRKAAADARWRKANGRGDASAYANDMTTTTTTTTTNTDTGEEAFRRTRRGSRP